jgi:hypothetical protein
MGKSSLALVLRLQFLNCSATSRQWLQAGRVFGRDEESIPHFAGTLRAIQMLPVAGARLRQTRAVQCLSAVMIGWLICRSKPYMATNANPG